MVMCQANMKFIQLEIFFLDELEILLEKCMENTYLYLMQTCVEEK